MGAGVNYNKRMGGPWNSRPNVIGARKQGAGEKEDFHIGGSESASGVVWKVGKNVKNIKVGDEVVIHCGMWDVHDPQIKQGVDPMSS